jgi:hypothetical protein
VVLVHASVQPRHRPCPTAIGAKVAATSWALLLTLAGCLGASGTAPKADQTMIGPASLPPDRAALVGLVMDDEFLPVPDARVLLLPVGAEATPDGSGRVAFWDLQPGHYKLVASASGYLDAETTATAEAGEVRHFQLELRSIAHYGPRVDRLQARGHIGCSVGWAPATTADQCKPIYPGPNSTYKFEYGAGLEALAWELRWTQTHALSARSLSSYFTTPSLAGCRADGPAPLIGSCVLDRTTSAGAAHYNTTTPIATTFGVRAAPGTAANPNTPPTSWWTGASGVVTDQVFDFYIHLFYYGAELPDAYSPYEA